MALKFRKIISMIMAAAFICASVKSPAYAQMADDQIPRLPPPGVMVHVSPVFTPAHLMGITIHPDNALQFDFLIQKGDQNLADDQKQEEYTKLVKYFLASLTIPDDDQWVNLSPYEKHRIIQDDFGKTKMGRDLLVEDYLLKQITSSLIYPENGLGKQFWDTVYERAWKEYGTTQIPVNTFNKVWIVPDQAYIYESGNSAYILQSHLKVMLEEDYLSLKKHVALQADSPDSAISQGTFNDTHAIGSQVIREIILPELEREVNEGKNFANLRQMYSGMILATWYKNALRESLLGKVYADKSKIKGVDQDPRANELIYQRYLKAFKKGVFNYIKDDVDMYTNEEIPRKYFSGGFKTFARTLWVEPGTDLAMTGTLYVVNRSSAKFLPPEIAYQMRSSLPSENSLDRATVALNTAGSSSGIDAAMQAWSVHVSMLTAFLQHLKFREDLQYLIKSPKEKNIFKQFFDGENVLNVWPEDEAGILLETNIMTALQAQGINAMALSPVAPNPSWPPNSFKKGIVQLMPFEANEFDNIIIASLFENYYWTSVASRTKNPQKISEMDLQTAEELQRVLTNNGRFFLLNASNNVEMIKALKDVGFEEVFNRDNMLLFINHKYPMVNTEMPPTGIISRNDTAMIAPARILSSNLDDDIVKPSEVSAGDVEKLLQRNNGSNALDARDYYILSNFRNFKSSFLNTEILNLLEGIDLSKLSGEAVIRILIFNGAMKNPADSGWRGWKGHRPYGIYPPKLEPHRPMEVLGNLITFLSSLQGLEKKFLIRWQYTPVPQINALTGYIEDIGNYEYFSGQAIVYLQNGNERKTGIQVQYITSIQVADHDGKFKTIWTNNQQNFRKSMASGRFDNGRAGPNTPDDFAMVGEGQLGSKSVEVGGKKYEFTILPRINQYFLRISTDNGQDERQYRLGDNRESVVVFWSHIPNGQEPDAWLGELIAANEEQRKLLITQRINVISSPTINTSHLTPPDRASLSTTPGGIDFNAAHLNMRIKRDGNGVPLPLEEQDMAQLSRIQGFEPQILEIQPALNVPIISELQQRLQPSST